jgi:RsiW-degrading membrane proteinase PrsW (M82 family)
LKRKIEELGKLLGLVLVARQLPRYAVHDGIVVGEAVRFGFAHWRAAAAP